LSTATTARPLFLLTVLLCLPALAAGAGDQPARRIVSLAPNVTEILYQLGLADRIAGVTGFCDYPAAAREKPQVGGFANPSAERIAALRPDLVIVQPNVGNRAAVETVQRMGVDVLIVDARSFDELFETIAVIGEAAGEADRATALARDLRDEIDALSELVRDKPRPRVLLTFSHDPYILVGQDSFPGEMIRLAGGRVPDFDTGTGYPRVGIETILEWAPEVILETGMGDAPGTDLMAAWQRWPSLPAVARNRVHAVTPDLVTRAGPRSPEGLRELIRIIHPGALDPETPAP
jgi:iron complex transport system substrate-binding protein